MTRIFAIILLSLAFCVQLSGQKTFEVYTKAKDSLRIGTGKTDFLPFNQRGYTLVLPDSAIAVNGVIISLEDDKFDLAGSSKQQICPDAISRGFAILYLSTGIPMDFYFSEDSYSYVDSLLSNIFKTFKLPDENIFFLGVSLAGHRALKFIEYMKAGKSRFKAPVKGVVLCDGVLDWVRQWYEEKKAVRDNFAPSAVFSGKLITYLFEKHLKGTPKTNIEAYLNFSAYSYFDERNRHLRHFTGLVMRAYTEPATFYWMNKRRKGVFDTNFPDIVGIVNELKLLGNEKNELIVFNQDQSVDDRRNPYYTWSLVDKSELMEWMVKQVNSGKPSQGFER